MRFIQLTKNQTYHSGIKRSPYEAIFGTPTKIGLSSSRIPKELLPSINSEEELKNTIEEMENSGTSRVTNAWDDNDVVDVSTEEEIEEAFAAALLMQKQMYPVQKTLKKRLLQLPMEKQNDWILIIQEMKTC